MKKFKVGDKVCWSSQSGGVSKFKVGTVVAVVPAECIAQCFLPDGFQMRGAGMPRNHESYLVKEVNKKYIACPLVKYLKECYYELDSLTVKRMEEINKGVLAQKAEYALLDLSSSVYSGIDEGFLQRILKFAKETMDDIKAFNKYHEKDNQN